MGAQSNMYAIVNAKLSGLEYIKKCYDKNNNRKSKPKN